MAMPANNYLPSPTGVYLQHKEHSGASVTPLVVVLVVIGILGVAAAVVGRLCATGRLRFGGHYDLEDWIEQKCASCIDGRVEISNAPPIAVAKPVDNGEASSKPAA